jgi:oligosaccharide repeat unit polymerase
VWFYISTFFLFFIATIIIVRCNFFTGSTLFAKRSDLPGIIDSKKIYILYPLMALAIGWFLLHNFTTNISDFNANRSEGNKESGPIIYLISVIIPNILGFRMLSDKKMKLSMVILFISISISSLLVGFRGPFLANIFFLFLIRYKITGKWFQKKDSIYVAVLALVVGIYGGLRNSNFEAGSFNMLALFQATILRVSSFELIGIMDHYVSVHGFDLFYHNFRDDVWIMIPRGIIASKPISLSEVIANNVFAPYLNSIGIFKDDYGGVAYTAIGEGLYNAGVFGVAIYGIFLGFLFSVSDKLIKSNSWVLFLIGKAVFVNILGLVEATQLGINAVIMNILTSLVLFTILKK